MTDGSHGPETDVPLLATGLHRCPYLPDRMARTAFVDPRTALDDACYGRLIQQNFRRSGNWLYRPVCPTCEACRSLRIPLAEFRCRRRHRRCLRRNARVEHQLLDAAFRPEHYALYRRYVTTRHAGGSMASPSPATYRDFLFASWCDTRMMELREDGRLLAVGVLDMLPDGLSAAYTFYDPDAAERGLGSLALLHEIEYARGLGLPYLYLGYWIDGCARMAYKADYRPHEVFSAQGWQRVD